MYIWFCTILKGKTKTKTHHRILFYHQIVNRDVGIGEILFDGKLGIFSEYEGIFLIRKSHNLNPLLMIYLSSLHQNSPKKTHTHTKKTI